MIAAATISVGFTVHHYWESVLRVEIDRSLTQKAQLLMESVIVFVPIDDRWLRNTLKPAGPFNCLCNSFLLLLGRVGKRYVKIVRREEESSRETA